MGFTRHKGVADVGHKYLFLYDFNLKYTCIEMNSGAPDLTNLEPENVQEIFAELEDWGHILGADPLISRKLKEFEAVASQKLSTQQKQTSRKVSRPVRGPSL